MLTPFVLVVSLSYSPWLKPFAGVGNVATACIASLPFVYGAEAAGDIVAGLPLLAIAVPLHFAREVAKDVPDIRGDSGYRRTIPIALGLARTRAIVGLAVAVYAGAVTFLFAGAGPRLGLLLPSVAVAAAGAWSTRVESARRAPALLKLAMLLAMAALPFLR
jgi:4-hydroxybenzoate polyprenyltransferase